jgi:endonuclease/exonuclease/phosphatase family metal-dependent hydrolase
LCEGTPVILTGDFNTTEDDPPHATLVSKPPDAADRASLRLIDSYREVHPDRTSDEATFHGFTGRRAGKRIDWIIHTPEFRATECEIVHHADGNRYPSDHFPVFAILKAAEPK